MMVDLAVAEVDTLEVLVLAVAAHQQADREDVARGGVVLQGHAEEKQYFMLAQKSRGNKIYAELTDM